MFWVFWEGWTTAASHMQSGNCEYSAQWLLGQRYCNSIKQIREGQYLWLQTDERKKKSALTFFPESEGRNNQYNQPIPLIIWSLSDERKEK